MRPGKHFAVQLLILINLMIPAGISTASPTTGPAPPVAEPNRSALTVTEAIVLGAVEGLTEYLPVSSTGHLLVAGHFMSAGEDSATATEVDARTKDASDAYTICIQAGAIIAVLGLYFGRVRQMLGGLTGSDGTGRQLLINVLAGFVPAAVIGLLFNQLIKSWLFGTWPVILAWLAGGLAILAVGWRNQGRERTTQDGLSLEEMTWRMALIIGFAQCIAMWPGVSRSLVTIVGGVMVGLSLPAAVEFSFLLGLVTLSAATGYDTLKHGQLMLQTFDAWALAAGVVMAFITAVVSVKWMVGYLNRNGLAIFGYYRVGLALVTGALLMGGIL